MKYIKYLFSLIVVVALISQSTYAHSGRTDSQGGHMGPDGYHWHHGEPAHQHYDGVCELEVADDKASQKALKSFADENDELHDEISDLEDDIDELKQQNKGLERQNTYLIAGLVALGVIEIITLIKLLRE